MKLKFHHIGLAVKNLDAFAELFNKKLGIDFEPYEQVESQKVKVAFSEAETMLELVEATQERSPQFPLLLHPILAHIKNKGEGLHHICFSVDNMEEALAYFSAKGVKLLNKEPILGAKQKRIVFIDPNETGGILVEIKEEKT